MIQGLPRQVFLALLFHLDVQQHERMHTQICILFHPVVVAVGFPCLREKYERHSLPEVVQLQTTGPNSVHDARIVDYARGDTQSACTEHDIGMRSGTEWVADDKERDVLGIGVFQDLVGLCFDHISIGEDDGLFVERFLLQQATA